MYSIVTFGRPSAYTPKTCADLDRAIAYARRAKGSGSCSDARVYECESRSLASSADIAEVRDGERVVWSA